MFRQDKEGGRNYFVDNSAPWDRLRLPSKKQRVEVCMLPAYSNNQSHIHQQELSDYTYRSICPVDRINIALMMSTLGWGCMSQVDTAEEH